MSSALDLFCDPIRSWFTTTLGEPTEIQDSAWPRIAAGEHVLVSAPTGSGKTLAAFLWALDRLLTGAWEPGRLRVLYVSPLRALGNDVRRNLLTPLAALPDFAGSAVLPSIRVETRTGDTPQSERRKMLRVPPEILITTPESLNILLTSRGGRALLTDIETVILDEVHAVVGGKRGIHLISAVERLVPLSGEFQRIALSATVHPAERIARWVGGHRLQSGPPAPTYSPRPVSVLKSTVSKRYDLQVRLPNPGAGENDRDALWSGLTRQLKQTIGDNRSTLVFANSRRMVEKVARMINEQEAEHLAYSHHGALSREIRSVVEERLKQGELRAIVATNSLELGIDIGSIDQVAMIQAPPSISSTVQRLGRSGHGVGLTSRGRLYPLHVRGLIDAAVVSRAAVAGEIEPINPISGALDVLAQIMLSMTVAGTWQVDELFAAVRCSDPYHDLPRTHFDLVLEMLAGRYASTRVRSLRPLVSIDGIDQTVRARPGADRLLYLAGGTITDRGYYQLRIEGSGSPVGELDEEFVWERSVGDTFTLGVQTWRVQSVSHNDVFVVPAGSASAMAPFWRAEERNRSAFLSAKLGDFLEWATAQLQLSSFCDELASTYHLNPDAALELRRLLLDQQTATGTLPHRHQVVEEHTASSRGRGAERQIVLHTLWGGRVNRPLAIALAAAWKERHGQTPAIIHDDDCIMVTYPGTLEVSDLLEMVRPETVHQLLRESLAGSGFFGARFREAAGCALLLPRAGFRRRTPLWVHRQRAKELLEAVSGHDDFPVVLEAWRSCLQDELDVDALTQLLHEVREGRIAVQRVVTESPSPFASHVLWKQTNDLMYDNDTPLPRRGPGVREDLLREVAMSSHLRPRIPADLAAKLTRRLHRTAPGYAPADPMELVDWVRERVLIPAGEWQELLSAVARDHQVDEAELGEAVADRVVVLRRQGGSQDHGLVCHLESVVRIRDGLGLHAADLDFTPPGSTAAVPPSTLQALHGLLDQASSKPADSAAPGTLADLLSEWLRFYGPVTLSWLESTLNISGAALDRVIKQLVDDRIVVVDRITDACDVDELCDRENLERLLRMKRSEARPAVQPISVHALPLHLACQQGVGDVADSPEGLQRVLETLFGVPAPAALWESDILPARMEPYMAGWLDGLLADTDLRWIGHQKHRLSFVLDGDRELLLTEQGQEPTETEQASTAIFPQPWGRFPFDQLLRHAGCSSAELGERLWQEVWHGRVSSDSFAPLRLAAANGFAPPTPVLAGEPPRSRRRTRLDRWRSGRPFSGNFFPLETIDGPHDLLDAEELNRDRARLLLDRYGIVFRQLLERELPALRWSAVFRTLRLMELSGEVVAGHFIDGVHGLHFASHSALRRLVHGLPEDRVWWLNATDPASPCGLRLEGFDPPLPKRLAGNHLVFHGRRLVVVSEGSAKKLTINAAPEHPQIGAYLGFIKVLLTRDVQPLRSIAVTLINGEPAPESPYTQSLTGLCHVVRSGTGLRLSRTY